MPHIHPRIVMVSNRLPIRLVEHGDGYTVKESPGGLVRALGSVMRRRGGVWIGWAGISGEVDLDEANDSKADLGYQLDPVPISEKEHELYYRGFSNEVIWPLFHDLHTFCNFDERYWEAYTRVNRRFAEEISIQANPHDLVWVHDYHLMTAGQELRRLGNTSRLGYFLHIPFPGPDVFRRLPWRREILDGLLHYDTIGFQTRHDLENFIQTVRALREDVTIRRPEWLYEIHLDGRTVRAGTFPIGIDVDEIRSVARSTAVQKRLDELRHRHRETTVILGVDRLDYTKGIPARLDAFERVLRDRPDLHGKIELIQHMAPSREDVPRYGRLKDEIEQAIGRINGAYGTLDWTPIHYLYNTLDFIDLVALYRLARVALITPLKDGMNLVSMEYCAAQVDGPGTLVLSEFAGSAQCVKESALLVNPHDTDAVSKAITRAVTMPFEERRRRQDELMDAIRAHDVFEWVSSFLEATLADPPAEVYDAGGPLAHTPH